MLWQFLQTLQRGNDTLKTLKIGEKALGAALLCAARRLLDMERFNNAILKQHRIALRADSEAYCRPIHFKPDRFCEITIAVGEERNLPLSTAPLPPSVHNEDVVHRRTRDQFNAFGFEVFRMPQKARQMHA